MYRFKTKTMRNLLIFISFLIPITLCHAQPNADSLMGIWRDNSQADTIRLEAFRKAIFAGYLFSQPDSAFYYAEVLYDEAGKLGLKEFQAEALNIKAGTFFVKGDLPQAIPYSEEYLRLLEENWPNSEKRAHALLNLGQLYSSTGSRIKALHCFEQSLSIAEEHDYTEVIGGALMQLGNEYETLGNYDLALEYLERSLLAAKKSGDPGRMGVCLTNIGIANESKGEFDEALKYHLEALELHEKMGDAFYVSGSLLEVGSIYLRIGDFQLAEENLLRGVEISKSADIQVNVVRTQLGLGRLNLEKEEFEIADEYCSAALDKAMEFDMFEEEMNACQCLYKTNKALGRTQAALVYFEKSQILMDSLKLGETAGELQRMEFEKALMADSLRQEEEKHEMELAYQDEIVEKDRTRNMLMGGGLLMLLIATGLFSRNRYVTRSKKEVLKEKNRSDELLLNILPAEVAEELKVKGKAEAQLIDQVTILFTDFKGFTSLSEKLSPRELVSDLNTCFSEFDRIMAKYGIEKIKTIGDAYMAAGGLPTPNSTHANDVVKAALEIRDFVENGKQKKIDQGLPYFEVRIGIHSGPVVAGIVGVKKFQYDIWGDTVNTASRLESQGEVGKVNISSTTYDLIKDANDLSFESRGKIATKGKGEVEMFFVSEKLG